MYMTRTFLKRNFFEDLQNTARQLKESELPRQVNERGGEAFYVYELDDGRSIGMPTKLTDPAPRLSAGPALAGPWVEYTPLEQKMLANGSVEAVVLAICAATTGIGCAVAQIMAIAAMTYISEKGVCSNDRRLLVEYTWGGTVRGVQCR